MRRIRDAVRNGTLEEPFTPRQVEDASVIRWADRFLRKHMIGNTGGDTELFERVSHSPVSYRINPSRAEGCCQFREP